MTANGIKRMLALGPWNQMIGIHHWEPPFFFSVSVCVRAHVCNHFLCAILPPTSQNSELNCDESMFSF